MFSDERCIRLLRNNAYFLPGQNQLGKRLYSKNLLLSVNFFLKTCRQIRTFIHKTSGLAISISLPYNGWFSCKLKKTYCNLANFD